MTDTFDVVDDPWQIDDIGRRAMQFLFQVGETEAETARRRDVRSALLGLYAAISANDAVALDEAMTGLWQPYARLFNEQVAERIKSSKPIAAHPNDFDVVAYQHPETK